MKPTYIIHGPQGSGKTRHAFELAEFFGCTDVRDEWLPGMPLLCGALHLTQDELVGHDPLDSRIRACLSTDGHCSSGDPSTNGSQPRPVTIMPLNVALRLLRNGVRPN